MLYDPEKKFDLLIIEDNPGDYVLIEEYLNSNGLHHRLEHAQNFREAERITHKSESGFDAVLLDLNLPDLEGEKLIKATMEMVNPAPVIILTGYSDMQFSIKSLSMGISDYILKDKLSSHNLWKSIRYSIERKSMYQKLRYSEQRYRDLFEHNPSPMIIWEIDSRKIIDCNGAAVQKYGYSKKQFTTLTVDDLQLEEGLKLQNASPLNAKLDREQAPTPNKVWRHRKKNGEIIFVESSGHQIEYRGRNCSLVLLNDVTDTIAMQEMMLESAIKAEEEERNRIANELHDSVLQQMVACGMFTQNLHDKVNGAPELKEDVAKLHSLIRDVITEARDMSHNLKPAHFETSTFPELIIQLSRQLTRDSGVEFKVKNFLDDEFEMEIHTKTNLYRVLQELCTNVIKHSGGEQVVISFEIVDSRFYLTVQDDGVGYREKSEESSGIGLKNVKSRIYRIGGEIEFADANPNGLQVNIEVDL
ncbi:MAG: response regulator [Balneolaceae bacterium]